MFGYLIVISLKFLYEHLSYYTILLFFADVDISAIDEWAKNTSDTCI